MTENPIDTARRRSIMDPKRKSRKLAEYYNNLANAEEEIERWTNIKINAELDIEKLNAKEIARTESVREGSGSEEGCEGITSKTGG